MKNQRKMRGKGLNPKNPQSKQQTKQRKEKERERSEICRQMIKKKKRIEAKENIPSKCSAQTEETHRTAVEAKLK